MTTALDSTVREVLYDATRCSVAKAVKQHPGNGPWPMSNITGPPAVFTLLGLAAAQDAGLTISAPPTFAPTMIDSLTRSHRSQTTSVWPKPGKKNDWTRALAFAKQITALAFVSKKYQDRLLPGTWDRLRACVASEAARASIPYWKKPDGTFYPGRRPGDSKAEEVSWSAQLFHVAMLLGIPGYDAKCEEAIRAAFSVPQDGLPEGYNVDADFEVENHVLNGTPIKPHAEYQRAVHLSQGLMLQMATLFNANRPLGLFRHLVAMYDVLTKKIYRVEDGYDPPGGVIYRPDGTIYNPRGTDKPDTANVMQFALIDAIVAKEHPDRDRRRVALEWCRIHVQRMRDAQLARASEGFKDGRAFTKAQEFPHSNQQLARGAAETYWALT